ncbi:MAG: hypothetical protein ACI9XJ_001751 [Marivirga sp.]|jgi:hypothetical protein
MIIEKTITKNIFKGILLFILLSTSNYGFSQSDQVELKDSLSFNYKFNASMSLAKGRLNQLMVPLSLHTTLSNTTFGIDLVGSYVYQKLNGFPFQNEIITRGTFTLFPQKRIRPIAGYIYESSLLYQMKSRHAPGLGFGLTVIKKTNHELRLNSFASYDKTAFENVVGYETFRANFILFGSDVLIKDRLHFNYTFYYFQSVQEGTNYTLRFEPKLLFKLSKIFSLSANLNYRYENIVDPISTKENLFMTVGFQIANMR